MHEAALFFLCFTAFRLLIAVINLLFPCRTIKKPLTKSLNVSVLIPARNEEFNIENICRALFGQSYPAKEIIVYDDMSDDNTADILQRLKLENETLRIICGKEIPAGFTGKNHGCDVLASMATGDVFIFLDADVQPGYHFISTALASFEKKKASLLSIFPKQICLSAGERFSVPLLNWVLLSSLPLFLVRHSPFASMRAANGQCMIFDAAVYRSHRFHSMVAAEVAEDLAIAGRMKRMKLKTAAVLAGNELRCRMYNSGSEAIRGFSKNFHNFFGKSRLAAVLFMLASTFGWLPVLLSGAVIETGVWLLMASLMSICTSLASAQPVLPNLITALPRQMTAWRILYRNIFHVRSIRWKGRRIDVS
jgi:glycosyltransferase involved in cell wall biosynthesis